MTEISSIQIGQKELRTKNSYAINFGLNSLNTFADYANVQFPFSNELVAINTDKNNSIFEIKDSHLYFKKKGIIQVNSHGSITTSSTSVFYYMNIQNILNTDIIFANGSCNEDADNWTIVSQVSGSHNVNVNDYLDVVFRTSVKASVKYIYVSIIFTEI